MWAWSRRTAEATAVGLQSTFISELLRVFVLRPLALTIALLLTLIACGADGSETADTISVGDQSAPPDVAVPAPDPQDQAFGDVWAQADSLTLRLSPEDFHQLPQEVEAALRDRGCTIPQADWINSEPHNVIQGAFSHLGEEDWAVLCSQERHSVILVFGGGSAQDVDILSPRDDADFLQEIGDGRIGFSRVLSVADAEYIRTHHARYRGPTTRAIDHDGINDMFAEKASVVHYFQEGEWVALSGAD